MAVEMKNKVFAVTGRATGMWSEFKNFAFKGNLIDLAVAVVLGAAFGRVIEANVKGDSMPLISSVDLGKGGGYERWHIGRLQIGAVLAELLNFTLVALAIFIVIVKLVGAMMKRSSPPPAPGKPVEKECPFCLMNVPYLARKCGHCTSELPELTVAEPAA